MKRTPLRRVSKNPANVRLRAKKKADVTLATKKLPRWIRSIPEGSHGSGTLQKRLWRMTSDFVRIRDWYRFKGRCIATGKVLPQWSAGQAGHFKAYSKCNGMFKFDPINIHLQSAQSNSWGDYDDWSAYEVEMVRRWGVNRAVIDALNRDVSPKISNELVRERMKDLLVDISNLPVQPEWYWQAAKHFPL